jgi:hypothetical protein
VDSGGRGAKVEGVAVGELAAAYREASESASDLADEWDGSSDEAWDDLDE